MNKATDHILLRVEKTCDCGFMLAFEFANNNCSKEKIRLHFMEERLKKWTRSNRGCQFIDFTLEENKFVAVYVPNMTRILRGYITDINPTISSEELHVFFIDYGFQQIVSEKDVKKLPDEFSVQKFPALVWRIALYGVLSLHRELNFEKSSTSNFRASKTWNGKDIHYMKEIFKQNDVIRFQEVTKCDGFKFGMIYVQDPDNKQSENYVTLQELLIEKKFAVKVDKFDEIIPSITRRFQKSVDYIPLPFAEDGNETEILSDNESIISVDVNDTDLNDVTAFVAEIESLSVTQQSTPLSECSTPFYTPPTSFFPTPTPTLLTRNKPPVRGRSRGEFFQKLNERNRRRNIRDSSPIMVGRLPEIEPDQFADPSILDSSVIAHRSSPNKNISDPSIIAYKYSPNENISDPSIIAYKSSPNKNISDPSIIAYKSSPNKNISDPSIISFQTLPNSSIESTSLPPSSAQCKMRITPSPERAGETSITPSPIHETPKKGRGRGEFLKNLLNRSSGRKTLREENFDSPPRTTKVPALDLLSDIVELPPPDASNLVITISSSSSSSNRSVELGKSTDEAPETIVISSTESLPGLNQSTNLPKTEQIVDAGSLSSDSEVEEVNTGELERQLMINQEKSYQDKLIDKIMVLGCEGNRYFEPHYLINEHDINFELKERLSQLRVKDLMCGQPYMIPAVLTRRNVTLIDGPKTGKTLSCMIALLSLLKEEKFYEKLPMGHGPKAIVLCPYSSRCEFIYQQCYEVIKRKHDSFVEGRNLKLNVAYGIGKQLEMDKMDELLKGYDVVICTPSCLLRLLQIPEKFNFKRLCHLVLDEAHILFDSYAKETVEIVKKAYESAKNAPNGLVLPQRIIISNTWLPKIASWIKDDLTKDEGIVLLSSYLEAAVFSKLQSSLKYLDGEEKKRNDLLEYLNNEAAEKSVIIVFNESQTEAYNLYSWLKSNCKRDVKILTRLHTFDRDIINEWEVENQRKNYPILVCNDYTLPDLKIYEADCLIHYGLPEKKNIFSRRFSLILNKLNIPATYLKKQSPVTSVPETTIYMNHENHEQFPTVVSLMERLNVKVPTEIKNISNKIKLIREEEKKKVTFCHDMKKFARCYEESVCQYRHRFTEYDRPDSDIPQSGFVKIHILQVHSATHYSVRLLERRVAGHWEKVTSIVHPYVINTKVNNYLRNPANRALHICESEGEVAAYEFSPDEYKRVKVIKIVERELLVDEIEENEEESTQNDDDTKQQKSRKVPCLITVKFMEDGKIMDLRNSSALLKLPEELASIPAAAIDVYLCNLLPVDRDIEWGDIISNLVRQKIKEHQSDPEKYFVGKIEIVAGRDIWMTRVECRKWFGGIKDFSMVYSVYSGLLKEKMAVVNDDPVDGHLAKLLHLYISAGFEVETPSVNENDLSASTSSVEVENENAFATAEVQVVDKCVEESWSNDSIEDELKQVKSDRMEPESCEADDENSQISELQKKSLENCDTESTVSSDGLQKTLCNRNYQDSLSLTDSEEFDFQFSDETMQLLINQAKEFGILKNECDEEEESQEYLTKHVLKPKVNWYQDFSYVYLRIDLNVDDFVVRIDTKNIYFRAMYSRKCYEFSEELYNSVNEDTSTYCKSGVHIAIKLDKLVKRNRWTRLLKRKDAQHWVKINVEHIEEDDLPIPDEYFATNLCGPLAFVKDDDIENCGNLVDSKTHIHPDDYGVDRDDQGSDYCDEDLDKDLEIDS